MRGRLPQNPALVPPAVKGDFVVKNKVLGGGSDKLAGVCLSEMQEVFLCFKKFNFNEEACSNEIRKFKNCYDQHRSAYFKKLASNPAKQNAEKLTRLLQRFPERKKDRF